MKLIYFNISKPDGTTGETFAVNPEHVAAVVHEGDFTVIRTIDGRSFYVSDNIFEVAQKLNA